MLKHQRGFEQPPSSVGEPHGISVFYFCGLYCVGPLARQRACSSFHPLPFLPDTSSGLTLALLEFLLFNLLALCMGRFEVYVLDRGRGSVQGPSCCREEHVGGCVGT